jgi:hypothetical protein
VQAEILHRADASSKVSVFRNPEQERLYEAMASKAIQIYTDLIFINILN